MKHFFKKHFNFIELAVFALALIFSVSFFNFVESSTLDNVSGYAWNADQSLPDEPGGMGWLSFNCTSGGNCGAVDYGVNIDASGDIAGYAWSSNYGWLKFGGLSGFPTGGGTTPANAKLTGNNVTGWARFCSVADSPSTCLGWGGTNISNGGWDGWLSLSGTSPNYGVTLSGSNFSGYAWGGNDGGKNVVGWVDFSQALYIPIVSPTVTISATPANVPTGGSTVISWSGTGLINSATGCTASGGAGTWPGTRPSPSGTFSTGVLPNGTYNYSIQCLGANGVTLSNVATVQVIVGAVTGIDFYADPAVSYPPTYQTTLYWNAVPSSPGLTSCVADSAPPLNPATVPSWSGNVSNTPSSLPVSVPYNPTNYKLTCNNQFGNPVTSTISVARGNLPESVSLLSNGVSGGFTTLTWATVNVVPNSCHPSSSPSIPSWNNPSPKADNGSQSNVVVPNSAPLFTTYTLTCTGLYSGNSISVDVQLNENSGTTFNKKQPKYKEN